MPRDDDITKILAGVNGAEPGAQARLIDAVYVELRAMARARMAQETSGHTLQPTALVHDAYMRLVGGDSRRHWQNRRHFYRAAAEAMRRVLVDHARARGAQKRGGDVERITIDQVELAGCGVPVDVAALGEALEALAAEDARAAEVVNLRYLLGFTLAETAGVLAVTERMVTADWNYAKAWLADRLGR